MLDNRLLTEETRDALLTIPEAGTSPDRWVYKAAASAPTVP